MVFLDLNVIAAGFTSSATLCDYSRNVINNAKKINIDVHRSVLISIVSKTFVCDKWIWSKFKHHHKADLYFKCFWFCFNFFFNMVIVSIKQNNTELYCPQTNNNAVCAVQFERNQNQFINSNCLSRIHMKEFTHY